MKGLLDILGASTGNPQQDAALNHGLLQAGLALMAQRRGNFAQNLGAAGMHGLNSVQQYQQNQFAQQYQQAQIEEIKRKQVQQQKYDDYINNLPAGGQSVDPTQLLRSGVQAGAVPVSSYLQTQMPQSPEYKVVGGSLVKIGPSGVSEAFRPPETPEKDPEAIRVLKTIYANDPNGYQAALQRLGEKTTTHQPPVSVANYGSPVPVTLPDGSTGLVQPSNRAGAPPQLMTLPGSKAPLRPAKDPTTKDLTEAQAKATTFLGQMQAASKELSGIGGDMSALSTQAQVALAGGPANIAISQKAQRIRQARDQWSEAFLRFKTGAASTEAEVKRNNETFFPKTGDRPEVIEQKARMRQQAEQDMAIAAGRGASQLQKPDADNDPLGLR